MPHSSERNELLTDFLKIGQRLAVSANQFPRHNHELRKELSKIMRLHAHLSVHRYIHKRKHRRVRPTTHDKLFVKMRRMSDRKFKQKFRVTKELFEHILDRINNHAVFKNNSRNKQRSPRYSSKKTKSVFSQSPL